MAVDSSVLHVAHSPCAALMEVMCGHELRMDNQAAVIVTVITAAHLSVSLPAPWARNTPPPVHSAFISSAAEGNASTFYNELLLQYTRNFTGSCVETGIP